MKEMRMKTLLVIAALLLAVAAADAEMYKWVADDGSVTFKDTPPPSSGRTKKIKLYKDTDFAPAPPNTPEPARNGQWNRPATKQTTEVKNQRFSGTVEIYLTDWCGYCKQATSYMDSHAITYIAYNIEKDQAARQRHKQLGGRGVPLIIIGNTRMSGFSPAAFEQYMNTSR
jgi:glutaredoxin